jgi:excisionase family DNA binding protein
MVPIFDDEYVTVAEAATLVGVSASTIWRWVNQKFLPAYRSGPRKVRLKRADLTKVVTSARPIRETHPDEDVVIQDVRSIGPLTDQERRDLLAAIEESKRLHAEELARRSGKLFPPSYEIINEMRDERTRELQ